MIYHAVHQSTAIDGYPWQGLKMLLHAEGRGRGGYTGFYLNKLLNVWNGAYALIWTPMLMSSSGLRQASLRANMLLVALICCLYPITSYAVIISSLWRSLRCQ